MMTWQLEPPATSLSGSAVDEQGFQAHNCLLNQQVDDLILNICIMDTGMVMVVELYKGLSNLHNFVFFFFCLLYECPLTCGGERQRCVG